MSFNYICDSLEATWGQESPQAGGAGGPQGHHDLETLNTWSSTTIETRPSARVTVFEAEKSSVNSSLSDMTPALYVLQRYNLTMSKNQNSD